MTLTGGPVFWILIILAVVAVVTYYGLSWLLLINVLHLGGQ